MSLTLEQAKQLKYGDILVDNLGKRWKVNGRVKLWKRDSLRIRVPLKHGLYSYDALEDRDFVDLSNGTWTCQYLTLESELENHNE